MLLHGRRRLRRVVRLPVHFSLVVRGHTFAAQVEMGKVVVVREMVGNCGMPPHVHRLRVPRRIGRLRHHRVRMVHDVRRKPSVRIVVVWRGLRIVVFHVVFLRLHVQRIGRSSRNVLFLLICIALDVCKGIRAVHGG